MGKIWLSSVMYCAVWLFNSPMVFGEVILVGFYQPASHGAINAGATSPPTSADFVTALGATGNFKSEILASTPKDINIGPFNNRPGSFSGHGITITPSAPHVQFAYPVPGGSHPGPVTESALVSTTGVSDAITGLGLSTNNTYAFDVIATPLFSGVTESITLHYGSTTETISGLHFGQIAHFNFRTGATANGPVTLTFAGSPGNPHSEYLGFSGFAAHTVPEPSSLLLLGMGGLAIGLYRRFRTTAA